jgi:hypothetical protein
VKDRFERVAHWMYCATGKDQPSWEQWVGQMEEILTKEYRLSIIAASVRAIGR